MNKKDIIESNNMTCLRAHHDMDGVCSSYFTSYHVPNAKIEIWDGEFGDTTGLKKDDWMCDMKPIEDKTDGLNVLDHHGPYPLVHKYNLIYDTVPASLIAWREFKEEIPRSEWWKVASGIVGDGQPELIPPEVWRECPQLLNQLKTSAYQSYGKWKLSYYPIYKLLSSPINAFLRKSDFPNALRLITEAKSPLDIIYDAQAIKAKSDVRSEFEGCVKNCDSYDFQHLNVIIFYSKYRMSGYIASALQGSLDGKTVMAINRKTGRGSLRGELALYWKDKLKGLDYLEIGGHPGFCGCTLNKNVQVLIEDLTKLLQ